MPNCVICYESPAKSCSTCKSACYCSQECQKLDWSLHKILCKKYAALDRPPETPPKKLGILLPVDNPIPQLVWVDCPKITLPYGEDFPFDNPVVNPFLGDSASSESVYATCNQVGRYDLEHTLRFVGRDNWLNDGSKPNQAAHSLTKSKLGHHWRGNILILSHEGYPGGDNPYPDYQDITLADLRSAVDFLVEQLLKRAKRAQAELHEGRIDAVLIRCEGEMKFSQREVGYYQRYVQATVAKDDSIWSQEPIYASKVMGVPILVKKLGENPEWNGNQRAFDNQPATFLHLEFDPENPKWGYAPPAWQSYIGNAFMVRQDGKPLSREQGYAFAEYMQFAVSDTFENALYFGGIEERRAAVKQELNPKAFAKWLEGFKKEMMEADYQFRQAWKDVKSPFGP